MAVKPKSVVSIAKLGVFTPPSPDEEKNLPTEEDKAIALELPEALARSTFLIPLSRIEEDPDQPRKHFSEETLKEMAQSLIQNGQLQPISVRKHPEKDAFYIINIGARRFRAAKLANFDSIEAKIEDPATRYMQMAENLHRDTLLPLEIASFIEEQIESGLAKKEIAKRLGKSPAYVSRYSTLADSPDWIKKLSARGVCSDVTTLNDLAKLEKSGSVANLEEKVSEAQSFTRFDLEQLIDEENKSKMPVPSFEEQSNGSESAAEELQELPITEKEKSKPTEQKDPDESITVWIDQRKGYLQTKKVKVYFEDTGEYESVEIQSVIDALK